MMMFQQIWAISRIAFTEGIRQPVFLVISLTGILALSLSPSIATYTLDDDNILLIDMGLSTIFVTGLFMAAFTATGVLSTELENKTVLTVISKPIPRPVFVIAKFLGVGSALGLGFWTLGMVFLLSVRHGVLQTVRDTVDQTVLVFGIVGAVVAFATATIGNYLFRWVFTSTLMLGLSVAMTLAWGMVLMVGKGWVFQSPTVDLDPQLLMALILIFEMVLILAAVALAASTRLGRTGTIGICGVVMICGLISDHLHGGLGDRYLTARALSWIVPDLQSLWPGDALARGQKITGSYVWMATGYTALYIVTLLGLGIGLFQRRDIK